MKGAAFTRGQIVYGERYLHCLAQGGRSMIEFTSLHGTPMELVRDEDDEVLLRIYSDGKRSVQAEVYVDPEELIWHLNSV